MAKGKIGDVLALARENMETGVVEQVTLTSVDGVNIMPGIWYDINLKERQVILL